MALLYQNDDFGKDYVCRRAGISWAPWLRQHRHRQSRIEVTDPTIDSQVVFAAERPAPRSCSPPTTPKFAAQAIRRVHEVGWRPLHYLTNVSISVGAVMEPAGPETRHRDHRLGLAQGPDRSELGEVMPA